MRLESWSGCCGLETLGSAMASYIEAHCCSWQCFFPYNTATIAALHRHRLIHFAATLVHLPPTSDATLVHTSFPHFTPGDTPAKVKRLGKEVRDLHGRTGLPCHASAAIFLRHDADRMDKMRAIITGPEGEHGHLCG